MIVNGKTIFQSIYPNMKEVRWNIMFGAKQ